MAGTFKFELVSPERVLLSGDAEEAVLPGSEGEMTILAGHAPLVSTLRPGMIAVTMADSRKRIFVKSGFAEVDSTRVTVLAEKAFDAAELDGTRIAEELAMAEAELGAATDEDARASAERLIGELKSLGGRAA